MKKFYTLALSVMLCGSAFAEGRQPMVKNISTANNVVEASTTFNTAGGVKKAPARAAGFATIEDMAGAYEWTGQNLLQSNAPGGELTLTVTNPVTGAATISGFNQNFVLKATIDFAKGTVSIPSPQDLGKDSYGDQNYFYLKDVTNEGNVVNGLGSAAASVGTIDGTTIVFPELDVWAFGDYNDETVGWWYLCYANSMSAIIENENPNEGWEDFGTAVFEDGWMVPGAGEEPSDYPWTVNVQKSIDTPDLYRLDKPYMADGCPFDDGKAGYIVFSIADPGFVRVLPGIYSGMNNGANKLNFFNLDGFYADMGFTKEEIKAELPDYVFSTYADGVVNVATCRFNMPSAPDKAYSWTVSSVSVADKMVAKITINKLAGVDNVAIDNDADAPVEFFNLQGVRVDNPEAGRLVIKRQGSKVTKMVVR